MSHDETVRPNLNGHQQAEAPTQPDPEVVPKAERRRYPIEYKLHILAEADACTPYVFTPIYVACSSAPGAFATPTRAVECWARPKR